MTTTDPIRTFYIYAITNLCNGKRYVGSSVAYKNRWSSHRRKLNKNKHVNVHLQAAWNKYKADNFTFVLLETDSGTDKSRKNSETYWIQKYRTLNKKYGYNLRMPDTVRPMRPNTVCGGKNATIKPVIQYDLMTGKYIKEWTSASEAARALKTDIRGGISSISACCRGKHRSAGCYGWMFRDAFDETKTVKNYQSPFEKSNKKIRGISVVDNTEIIFDSVADAKRSGFKSISNVFIPSSRKKTAYRHTAYGYKWSYV